MSEQELKKLEDKLWAAADKMRGAVSVSDYKFIVLGLIFLKYISDSFEEKYKELVEEGAGLEEERDCYTAENIFYVPKNAVPMQEVVKYLNIDIPYLEARANQIKEA